MPETWSDGTPISGGTRSLKDLDGGAMYSTYADAHATLLAIALSAKRLLTIAAAYAPTWSVPQFVEDEPAVADLRRQLADYEREHGGLT